MVMIAAVVTARRHIVDRINSLSGSQTSQVVVKDRIISVDNLWTLSETSKRALVKQRRLKMRMSFCDNCNQLVTLYTSLLAPLAMTG